MIANTLVVTADIFISVYLPGALFFSSFFLETFAMFVIISCVNTDILIVYLTV